MPLKSVAMARTAVSQGVADCGEMGCLLECARVVWVTAKIMPSQSSCHLGIFFSLVSGCCSTRHGLTPTASAHLAFHLGSKTLPDVLIAIYISLLDIPTRVCSCVVKPVVLCLAIAVTNLSVFGLRWFACSRDLADTKCAPSRLQDAVHRCCGACTGRVRCRGRRNASR